MEVIEGFKSLPKRGLEIGGLLLGRVDAGSMSLSWWSRIAKSFARNTVRSVVFVIAARSRGMDRSRRDGASKRTPDTTRSGCSAAIRGPSPRSMTRMSLAQEPALRDGVGIFPLIRPSARGASQATVGISTRQRPAHRRIPHFRAPLCAMERIQSARGTPPSVPPRSKNGPGCFYQTPGYFAQRAEAPQPGCARASRPRFNGENSL